ncbi:hypothetical protein AVEN_218664-1 [Araneus ventricosus]|uniref:Uncharacterized protein n=1 Tax=Araneus ventricosus TaxID=182803 RepID=A0A4Y2B643_ARAVE|nr:hypothetical protein AVEN_218664-1 [Araneus ventricosus]
MNGRLLSITFPQINRGMSSSNVLMHPPIQNECRNHENGFSTPVIDEALPINTSLPQEQALTYFSLKEYCFRARRPGIFLSFHIPAIQCCEGEIYYDACRGNGTAFFDSSGSDCEGEKGFGFRANFFPNCSGES